MTASDQSARATCSWDALTLPGDGLIAWANDHVIVVEVRDDVADDGLADQLIAAHEAHNRLLGRGAAVSLRRSVDAILAEHSAAECAVALISTWGDQVAVALHGHAVATIRRGPHTETVDGREALIAADRTLAADFDVLEVHVGERPNDELAPLPDGRVVVGRGVRLEPSAAPAAASPGALNEWSASWARAPLNEPGAMVRADRDRH